MGTANGTDLPFPRAQGGKTSRFTVLRANTTSHLLLASSFLKETCTTNNQKVSLFPLFKNMGFTIPLPLECPRVGKIKTMCGNIGLRGIGDFVFLHKESQQYGLHSEFQDNKRLPPQKNDGAPQMTLNIIL